MKGFLFWLASLTWGIVMTMMGLLAAFTLIITGHKPERFHYFIYFKVGNNGGGFNMGPVFVISKGASKRTMCHEVGHGIQNVILGPLMLLLVSIPSVIRYWYREIIWRTNKEKYQHLPIYDSIWFEGWATEIGTKYYGK